MDFPGNSHTAARIEEEKASEQVPENTPTTSEPKKVKKVVTGKVTENKPTLGKRFKNMFVHDGGNFAEHVVEKVVVPMVKDMALSIATQMVDGFRQGVEEMLFGPDAKDRRGRTTSYGTGRPVVNYTRYSSTSSVRRSSDRSERDRDRDGSSRRSNRVREIIVESREDGDAVLEELDAIIDSSVGHCTVGDFYAACGERTVSTDEEWGWTDLRDARVSKLGRDEFLISMPRPRPIDG
jgi:hypothetical protein